jgi:hypothetical protein
MRGSILRNAGDGCHHKFTTNCLSTIKSHIFCGRLSPNPLYGFICLGSGILWIWIFVQCLFVEAPGVYIVRGLAFVSIAFVVNVVGNVLEIEIHRYSN